MIAARRARAVRHQHRAFRRRPPRRGGALLIVLFMTAALGAIAAAAVALTRTTTLVSAYYDRERDFRYAAEAALELGRTRVTRDTTIKLPDSGYVRIPGLDSALVYDANGTAIPRTRVTVYAGRSGIVSGQYGQFVTLVAKASDGTGTRYVRRLELAAENFARFAMFTNTWTNGLCYGTGEFIRGLAWSNQNWQSCGTPTYYDSVGAVGTITATGGTPTYVRGAGSARSGQAPIPMPTVSRLTFMPAYAAAANLSFAPTVAGAALRLDFLPVDVNANGDSTELNEGFVRVFQSNPADSDKVELPAWSGSTAPTTWSVDSMCGDYHNGKFYPVVQHKTNWFRGQMGGTLPGDVGKVEVDGNDLVNRPVQASEHDAVLSSATARCFLAGSPQLASVERDVTKDRGDGSGQKWQYADGRVGGDASTFTPNGRWGAWRAWPGTVDATLAAKRPTLAKWLFPLNKLNPGNKGVVYVNGSAFVSGTVRARVTLYASNALTFVDDLVYLTPPNSPGIDCQADAANILGVIAVNNVMIANNALNRPLPVLVNTQVNGSKNRFMSGTGPHFRLHGVVMSLAGTVGVIGYDKGPANAESLCLGQSFSGGCIAQVGGVIEQTISATYAYTSLATSAGANTGFAENREVDQCMLVTSPPYFPTTGRYLTNRYFESDPSRFNAVALYQSLQSN